jgi:hypothetical protein
MTLLNEDVASSGEGAQKAYPGSNSSMARRRLTLIVTARRQAPQRSPSELNHLCMVVRVMESDAL